MNKINTFTVKVYFDKIKQLDNTSYTDGTAHSEFHTSKITLKNSEAGRYFDFFPPPRISLSSCPINIWYKKNELQYKEKYVDIF